jgi:hypothetical protein
MRKTIALALIAGSLAFYLAGCAKISLSTQCPATSLGVSFALAGSTVGNQAIAMLGSAIGGAALMDKKTGSAPTDTTPTTIVNTMSYEYLPIFGADSGSLTCIAPVAPPTVVSTGPPPAILH